MTPAEGGAVSAVSFSRLSRRGLLLGLTGPQVSALATAVVVIAVAVYASGFAGLAWTAPLWGGCTVAAWLPVGGRPLVQWLPVALAWGWRLVARQTGFRRRVLRPRPDGTLALPGDAAALRRYVDAESRAVMVHDPHQARLVAVAEVSHQAFVLLDPADQQRRVQAWGRLLSGACRSGRLARLQVLERTLPDSGNGLARWWADHGVDDGSWVASTYRELIDRAGPAGEQHRTTVSLALDMKAAAREIRAAGGGMTGAATVLRREMRSLTTALTAADLAPVTWLSAGQLAVILRSAYDPQIAAALDRTSDGTTLATAGPLAVEEYWAVMRTDSGWHAVLWISEWPRSLVHPGFLGPMLLTGGVRRTFSLICEPVPAAVAARDIRRRKTGYLSDAAQRARIGQIEDVQQTAELHDVLQQEADLTAGHGLVRYAGLLAITAPTAEALDAAVADVEQAAVQSSCETRRLVGQQAQAFAAAALPLCRGI
jgi:hypothetical protein